MASSLLRSATCELRRSIRRRSCPPRLFSPKILEGSRLLSIDAAGKAQSCNQNKASSTTTTPNAAQFQLHLENLLRSGCDLSIESIEKHFSKDQIMEFTRYLRKMRKQKERDYLSTLEKYSDTLEERSSLLRQIKDLLESGNRRSAQKYRLVKNGHY
uniref:Uncharacterized protein n=1 Tax=Leersia perrieri TaxID=77586 RepID=A0A0D9XDG5_9ORYZ